MTTFNCLQSYDKFYIDNQLCFKLDEERYITPHGTHKVGDKQMRVHTNPRFTKSGCLSEIQTNPNRQMDRRREMDFQRGKARVPGTSMIVTLQELKEALDETSNNLCQ